MAERENRDIRYGPGNDLRIDLYRALIPQFQEEDQQSDHIGIALHWNDPDAVWNGGRLIDAWNSIGLAPVYQTLFYVLETLEGEEIDVLESMDALVDPFECPEAVLGDIAASFGYRLKEDLPEETKRAVVQGLMIAYKSLGQFAGFKCFYRMVGFRVIRIYPLWKKNISEDRNDYSRVRYDTSAVTGEAVGPAGTQAFATGLSSTPIKPGTVRIADGGTVVVKDEPSEYQPEGLGLEQTGVLVAASGEVGTINYLTGEVTLDLGAPAAGAVTADYEQVTEEWPYHAARLDIEILMNPGGAPIPLTDPEVFKDVLIRMDEIRPIHVILRAITLAFELEDSLSPGATDFTACTQTLQDIRDGYPLGFIPGLDSRYFLDQGPYPEENGLSIEAHYPDPLAPWDDWYHQYLADTTGFTCPVKDVLVVDTQGWDPNEGVY